MVAWPTSPLWLKAIALVLWAVIDESSKALSWFPGRHFSWGDLGLNLAGILIHRLLESAGKHREQMILGLDGLKI